MARYDGLEILCTALKTPAPKLSPLAKHKENNPLRGLPSIGAEIEVHWSTLLPEFFNEKYQDFSPDKKESFSQACCGFEKQSQKRYEATIAAGIPQDTSERRVFHEFAHNPVNWYETLAAEIEILFDAGLIRRGYDNPMHITIGSLSSSIDTSVAASIIQLSGGSTPQRITLPTPEKKAWADKGKAGLLTRTARLYDDLITDEKQAVEIRTLVAQNPSQVRETLRISQLLGAGIYAHQNNTDKEISDTWKELKTYTINTVLKPRGLNRFLPNPHEEKGNWEAIASLYGTRQQQDLQEKLHKSTKHIEGRLRLMECT